MRNLVALMLGIMIVLGSVAQADLVNIDGREWEVIPDVGGGTSYSTGADSLTLTGAWVQYPQAHTTIALETYSVIEFDYELTKEWLNGSDWIGDAGWILLDNITTWTQAQRGLYFNDINYVYDWLYGWDAWAEVAAGTGNTVHVALEFPTATTYEMTVDNGTQSHTFANTLANGLTVADVTTFQFNSWDTQQDTTVSNFNVVAPSTLTWNGAASGNWSDASWLGIPPNYPVYDSDYVVQAVIDTPGAVVTVGGAQSAATLDLTGAQVTVGPDSSLAVRYGLNAATGMVVLQNNSTLSVGSGTLQELSSTGDAAIGTGGPLDVATVTVGSGTLTKQGGGTMSVGSLSATGATLRVEDGTLSTVSANPLGGASTLELAGGDVAIGSNARRTISVNLREGNADQQLLPEDVAGLGGFRVPNWNDGIDGGSPVLALVDDTGVATTANLSWLSSPAWGDGSAGVSTPDHQLARGYFDDGETSPGVGVDIDVANVAYGAYDVILYLSSDHGYAGQYGSYTVNGQVQAGGVTTPFGDLGTWVQGHNALVFPGLSGALLDIDCPSNGGAVRGTIAGFQIIEAGLPAYDLSGTDVTVSADSSLSVTVGDTTNFGGLTLTNGTLTTSGSSNFAFNGLTVDVDPALGTESGINATVPTTYGATPVAMKAGILKTAGQPATFAGVNIDPAATLVGFNPQTATTYGLIDGGVAQPAVTIAKTGSATMTLGTGDTTNLDNATWEAREGTLVMNNTAALGGANELLLSGGALVFGSDARRTISVNFTDGNAATEILADETAGMAGFAEDNWNNSLHSWDNTVPSMLDLVDDSGAATGVNLSWTRNDAWWDSSADVATPDGKLAAGWNGDGAIFQATNVPYADYDVVLYMASDQWTVSAGQYGDVTVNGQTQSGGSTEGFGNLGGWIQNTNVFVFPGQSGPTLDIIAAARNNNIRATIAGIQIVQAGLVDGDFSGKNVTVTADSNLSVTVGSNADFGTLTLKNGILTTSGTVSFSFDGTTVDAADDAVVGVNLFTPVELGPIDFVNSGPVTFAKSGPVDLTLTAANIGGSGFDANVTFEVRSGRLIGVHGSNPFDQGNLQIAGGELVLAGAVSDVPVSFGNPVNVASGGTITAGPGNTGTTGVAVTLGGGVTLGGNTLTLASSDADGYTLGLTNPIDDAAGGVTVQAGDVTLAGGNNLGTLTAAGGNATVPGANTLGTLSVQGGNAMLAGNANNIAAVNIDSGSATLWGDDNVLGTVNATGGSLSLAGANGQANDVTVDGGLVDVSPNRLTVNNRLKLGDVDITINPENTFQVSNAQGSADLASGVDVVVSGGTLSVVGPPGVTETISVNFTDGNAASEIYAAEEAGLDGFVADNWNNSLHLDSETVLEMLDLVDDSGAATGVNLNWTRGGAWWDASATNATPDRKLAASYNDDGSVSQVTNIVYDTYDVALYLSSDHGVTGQYGEYTVNGQVQSGGVTTPFNDLNSWIVGHNALVFEDVTGATLDIVTAARNVAIRTSLAGFQIRHVLTPAVVDLPNVNLEVTATSILSAESWGDAIFGDLTLADGVTLTVQEAPALSLQDLTLGDGAQLGSVDPADPNPVTLYVRGMINVGSSPGTGTIVGSLEMAEEAGDGGDTQAGFHVEISGDLHDKLVMDGDGFTPGSSGVAWIAGTLEVTALKPMTSGGTAIWGDKVLTIMEASAAVAEDGGFLGQFGPDSPGGTIPTSYGLVPDAVPSQGDYLGAGIWFGNAGDDGVYYPGQDLAADPPRPASAVQIGVFQAAPGDTDGNRKVEGQDILNILQAGLFGDGVTTEANWGNGDFNADSKISGEDILALLGTGLFGDGTYPDTTPAAAAGAGVKLVVNADGLVIDTDGATLTGFVLSSESGILTGDDADNLGLFQEDTDAEISGTFAMSLNGKHDLGDVLGETDADLGGDLSLAYTIAGVPGVFTASVVVPEPGTLLLLLSGLIGLLIWRRRM